MKVAFVCPFNLDRLTGTPIRTKMTVAAVSVFADATVFVAGGKEKNENKLIVDDLGAGNIVKYSFRVIKKLKLYKPDVIHGVSTLSVASALVYKYFLNTNCKFFFEIHGWSWYETAGLLPLYKRIVFLFFDLVGFMIADKVIAMSFTQMDFLRKNLYSKKNIEVMWGPVDFEVNKNFLPEREMFKVGYLGNSSFWQGLTHVVECAALMENQNILFELGGFDPSNKIKFPDRKNIIYSGKIDRSRVKDFIVDKDVMISPRIKGRVTDLQYPQKLSEYLAGGRPVIVSDVNDQSLIVKKIKCGIVLDYISPQNLKIAIENQYRTSSAERQEMGMRAAQFAEEEFDFKVFSQKIKLFYEKSDL